MRLSHVYDEKEAWDKKLEKIVLCRERGAVGSVWSILLQPVRAGEGDGTEPALPDSQYGDRGCGGEISFLFRGLQ